MVPAAPAPVDLLEWFDDIADDLADRLAGLDDWGLAGARAGQYVHDLVADELIVAALLDRGVSVLTEESGVTHPPSATRPSITVVVDPIDGSTNASHGLPWYATSLCAVDADGPLASLVVNLASGERFRAIRGEGVETDRARFAPSSVERLDDALLAFSGLPPAHGGWRQYRTYGAIALDLCAVAAGSFDGYIDVGRGHGVWDYLGALLVCREAGVDVVDAAGDPMVVLDPTARRSPVAAGTPALLDQLLRLRRSWEPDPDTAS